MFGFLKKLFKKLFAFIKKFWWVFAILIVVFFPQFVGFLKTVWSTVGPVISNLWTKGVSLFKAVWPKITTFAANHGWLTTAAIGLGVLGVISPDAAKSVVGRVSEVVSDVVEAGAGVVNSGVSTLLKNPLVLVAGGVGLYLLLRRPKMEIAT